MWSHSIPGSSRLFFLARASSSKALPWIWGVENVLRGLCKVSIPRHTKTHSDILTLLYNYWILKSIPYFPERQHIRTRRVPRDPELPSSTGLEIHLLCGPNWPTSFPDGLCGCYTQWQQCKHPHTLWVTNLMTVKDETSSQQATQRDLSSDNST